MRRGMTRRELEITDLTAIKEILDKSKVVHIAMVDDGEPYMVTMNYGYKLEDGKLVIYVHGATKGRKLDVMRANPNVFIEMECDMEPFAGEVACQYGMAYASIRGKGKAAILESSEEKQEALSILMKTQTDKDFVFNDKLVSIVSVIRIDVEEYTAKKREMPPMAKKD